VVRAHHSDVGGVQAGALPAGAREIFCRGVIVPPLRLTPDVEHFLLANVRRRDATRGSRGPTPAVTRGRRVCAPSRRATVGRESAARPRTSWTTRAPRRDALGRFTATALTATDWLEGDVIISRSRRRRGRDRRLDRLVVAYQRIGCEPGSAHQRGRVRFRCHARPDYAFREASAASVRRPRILSSPRGHHGDVSNCTRLQLRAGAF